MLLTPTPSNPIPEGGEVAQVTARDGTPLRAAFWPARTDTPLGTVCIMQGRAEFIEKYAEVVEELLTRGFAVAAFDWHGQGGSWRALREARKGHVASFRHYRRDLQAIAERMARWHFPAPFFGLAHSMGGAIALDAARVGKLPFERLVVTAPMLGLAGLKRPRLTAVTARVLARLGFARLWIPGGRETPPTAHPFAGNPLTGDRRRYERNAEIAAAYREGAIGEPTIGWVAAAFRTMARLASPRAALAIRTPTLIVAAGADEICETAVAEQFGRRLKGGGVIVIPGARHEILMERDAIRAQFWAAFDAFIPGSQTYAPPDSPITDESLSAARQKG
ncbi:MAG: alpha/beta hydrolase [Salinarimonadaceae bacterium]|nr:MAG: alpha/beta hydrolase [Salinarimonadaceae bacterium]